MVLKFVIKYTLLVLLLGCSAASESNRFSRNCPKPQAQKFTSDALQASSLDTNIPVLSNPDDPALGIGYIDWDTVDENGSPVSRRCTVGIKKHPSDPSLIRLFTAKHCIYPLDSVEFGSAKTTLRIWANGGYFEALAKIDGQTTLSELFKKVTPYLSQLGNEKSFLKLSIETSEGAAEKCIDVTAANRSQMVTDEDRLACVANKELLILDARYSVSDKYKTLMTQVLNAVEVKRSHLSFLPSKDKNQLEQVEKLLSFGMVIPSTLKAFAYTTNINFCNAPPNHPITFRNGDLPLNNGRLCDVVNEPIARAVLISDVKSKLPPDLYKKYVKDILEQERIDDYSTDSQIYKWHQMTWGCKINSLDELDLSQEIVSECDANRVKTLYWNHWVINHPARLSEISLENRTKFGFNAESYFTLGVNSLPSQAAVDANEIEKSTAQIFKLGKEQRKFSMFDNSTAILFTFLPANEKMFLTKKDSGSLFSVFGVIPVAALSTIDGEATSGGAAITPLPEIEDDEAPNPVDSVQCAN